MPSREELIQTYLVTENYSKLLEVAESISDFYHPEFEPMLKNFGYMYQMEQADYSDFAKGTDSSKVDYISVYKLAGLGKGLFIHSEFTLMSVYIDDILGKNRNSVPLSPYFDQLKTDVRPRSLKRAEEWLKKKGFQALKDPVKDFYLLYS